ncbi:MAG: iron-sulfur cluster assembly accessory protein [Candidatus Thermoplasmatota archaeon]|nr:iron-sulfur cluster assembly accessory protein [Candidatus Thermoplasmatota archaeon]|tara:strand:- start:217 stop:603 length:387 start_codon:yes stop_codon:yes gene_type:complete
MGILGGEGFSLPVVTPTLVVDVEIEFTESAKQAMNSTMNDDENTHVVIISAQSGGCSGYMYDMKIVEDPQDDSFQRIDVGGMTVLVHNKDSTMLNGIRVDYKDTLMGGGFQIDNPNADRSCGCGQSFG